jgi:hypothetical protein
MWSAEQNLASSLQLSFRTPLPVFSSEDLTMSGLQFDRRIVLSAIVLCTFATGCGDDAASNEPADVQPAGKPPSAVVSTAESNATSLTYGSGMKIPVVTSAENATDDTANDDTANAEPIAAVSFPKPGAAEKPMYTADTSTVMFHQIGTVNEQVSFYDVEMKKLGWKKLETSEVADGVAFLDFAKGQLTIAVIVNPRDDRITTIAQGSGISVPQSLEDSRYDDDLPDVDDSDETNAPESEPETTDDDTNFESSAATADDDSPPQIATEDVTANAERDHAVPTSDPPAHVFEATDVLDMSQIPWPAGTDGANDTPTSLYYQGPGDVDTAYQFYDKYFADMGWVDVTASSRGDGRVFERSGFQVYLGVNAVPPGIMINMTNHGNFDCRRLPHPSDTEQINVSRFAHEWILSATSQEQVAEDLRTQFAESGWLLYRVIGQGDDVSFWFLNNGGQASVRVTSSSNYPDKTMVQYSVSMLPDELPVAEDATNLVFEDYPNTLIEFDTEMSFAETRNNISQQMELFRWQRSPAAAPSSDAEDVAYFEKGHQTATVTVTETGSTHVRIETSSTPSEAVLAVAARAQTRENERQKQERSDFIEGLKDALPVDDFPLPEFAENIFRNEHGSASGGDIRYDTTTSVAENLKFFRDQLTAKGWKEDKAETHDDETFGQLSFRKGKALIKFSVSGYPKEGKPFHGMLEGSGLVAKNDLRHDPDWVRRSGDDASIVASTVPAAAVSAEDLEALLNFKAPPSYDEWLKTKGYDDDVSHIEEYQKEIEAMAQELQNKLLEQIGK